MNIMYKYSLPDRFVIVALMTLPYDSMHVLPFTYRPLSLYFLVIAFFLYLYQDRGKIYLSRPMSKMILFIFVSLFVGTIVLLFSNSLTALKFYVPGISMGVLSAITFFRFFCKMSKKTGLDYIRIVFSFIAIGYTLAMIIGSLEALATYHVLPYFVKSSLNLIFGGWQVNRVCLVNSEASYASTHMCFVFPIFFYLFEKTKNKKYLYLTIWALVLMFITVSTKGYAILFFMIFLYPVVSVLLSGKMKQIAPRIAKIMVLIIVLGFIGYEILLVNQDTYFGRRILAFQGFSHLLESDGSAFTRIGLPLIATRMFLDNVFLGLGVGGFHENAVSYIHEYMPFALSLREFELYLESGSVFSCAIFFQVLANFGLYGLILFIRPFSSIFHLQRKIIAESKSLILLFVFFILMTLQNGNWAYMPFWMLFALFSVSLNDGCRESYE